MKIDRWRTFWVIAVLGFFGGSVALVFSGEDIGTAEAAAVEPSEAPAEPVIAKTDQGCLADAGTLADLRRQKIEIEARKTELNTREAELKAREQALSDQMKGLVSAREELEKTELTRKTENDGKVAKLVETVETMNPKAASALLASLDEALATATMARLSTPKLAKIMNVMDPARSTRLSELLAGVARAKAKPTSHDVAAATTERTPAAVAPATANAPRAVGPSKGGDLNDGKSHEQSNSSKTTPDGESKSPRR